MTKAMFQTKLTALLQEANAKVYTQVFGDAWVEVTWEDGDVDILDMLWGYEQAQNGTRKGTE